MNKKLYILPILAIAMTSCAKADYTSLKIVSPTGAPAYALCGEASNPNFETNGVPKNIVAFMAAEKYDVAVLPTNIGIQAINSGVNYKIAATVTFGNIFVAATGNDDDNVMDAGDSILLFQQGSVPDLVFHYVYGDSLDTAISYVDDAQTASKCLAAGKNLTNDNVPVDYVLMAEPALTTVLSNTNAPTYGKSSVYANLQEKYKEKSNGLEMFQASVFVKNSSDKEQIKEFLRSTEKSINSLLKNPDSLIEIASVKTDPSAFFGNDPAIAVKALKQNNGLGLGFKYASKNKDAIDNFLSLFGIGATSEEIYFK